MQMRNTEYKVPNTKYTNRFQNTEIVICRKAKWKEWSIKNKTKKNLYFQLCSMKTALTTDWQGDFLQVKFFDIKHPSPVSPNQKMANATPSQNRDRDHNRSFQVHKTQTNFVFLLLVFPSNPKIQSAGRKTGFSELHLGDEYKQVLETFNNWTCDWQIIQYFLVTTRVHPGIPKTIGIWGVWRR